MDLADVVHTIRDLDCDLEGWVQPELELLYYVPRRLGQSPQKQHLFPCLLQWQPSPTNVGESALAVIS